MDITWLGQAGLLFENENAKILVDPYLSDSCAKLNPNSYRRTAIDERYLKIKPDVIVLTHEHIDHTDPETLAHYLNEDSDVLVLASENAWKKAKVFGGSNNYVNFNSGTSWTFGNIRFTAVRAEHSDKCAIGVIVDDGEKLYYVTGDTLYNDEIFKCLPKGIDTVFLPINGRGNNMNAKDAERFAQRVGAVSSVPVHYAMFDNINPEVFKAENRLILAPYEKMKGESR